MVNSLNPYIPSDDKPWNAQRARHLYNRLGFGADWTIIANSLTQAPGMVVDQLINQAVTTPSPEVPYWANWAYDDYPADDMETYFQVKNEFFQRWIREMAQGGLLNKLALFWHNHFVTEEEVYDCNAYMWSYYELIHRRAIGNFRGFVEEMGVNPAMLIYLNGNLNVAEEPNENYARELMELFTIGEGNGYTQDDIVEVARALTGWRINMYECEQQAYFNPNLFDNGPKTIFGQTGNWDYDGIHGLIFSLRAEQVANYICGKLYRFFVYEKEDPEIVQQLANTFIENNWEIAPVLRQLFASEHFFESRHFNARIKSPVEALISVIKLTGGTLGDNFDQDLVGYMTNQTSVLGQEIFNPVDVAGWQEYHTWLSENTLTRRWNSCSTVLTSLYGFSNTMRDKLQTLAVDLTSPTESDPVEVTRVLTAHFLNRELDPDLLEVAVLHFKGDLPENYFEDGTWDINFGDLPEQILSLIIYLMRLPEWQLC